MGQLLSGESIPMSTQTPVAFDIGVSHETNSSSDNMKNLESDLAEQLQSKPNDEHDQQVLDWMPDEPDDDYDTETTAAAPIAEGETSATVGMVVTVASQSRGHSECTALGAVGGGTCATIGMVVTAASHAQGHSGRTALRAGSESVGAVSAASRLAEAAGSALSGRHDASFFVGKSQEAPEPKTWASCSMCRRNFV